MLILSAIQAQSIGSSIAPWVSIAALIVSLAIPAFVTKIRKEILAELVDLVEKTDKSARDDFQAEVLRISKRFDDQFEHVKENLRVSDVQAENRAAEIRTQLHSIQVTINEMEKKHMKIEHSFEMYKKELENRALEEELRALKEQRRKEVS